jgi:hypothetical protein
VFFKVEKKFKRFNYFKIKDNLTNSVFSNKISINKFKLFLKLRKVEQLQLLNINVKIPEEQFMTLKYVVCVNC